MMMAKTVYQSDGWLLGMNKMEKINPSRPGCVSEEI